METAQGHNEEIDGRTCKKDRCDRADQLGRLEPLFLERQPEQRTAETSPCPTLEDEREETVRVVDERIRFGNP